MLKSSEGIVLHSIKYGDSGRIVQMYTLRDGLKSFIVQGLGPKSNLRKSYFQHLNVLELVYYSKEKTKLNRIRETKIIKDNSKLEIQKLYILIFTAEFLRNSIKEEESNPHLYNYLKSWILELQDSPKPIIGLLNFTLNLSKYLGFFPLNNQGKYFNLLEGCFQEINDDSTVILSEANSALMMEFIVGKDQCSQIEAKEILNSIIRFYSFHLHNFREPKSRQMLDMVWMEN